MNTKFQEIALNAKNKGFKLIKKKDTKRFQLINDNIVLNFSSLDNISKFLGSIKVCEEIK